jgi:hypothetical protein
MQETQSKFGTSGFTDDWLPVTLTSSGMEDGMTQPLNTWTSQPEPAGSDPVQNYDGGYHPNCGEEHHHKPTKAIIGVGLLVVLSFLLYEFNGKPSGTHSSAAPPAIQHQSFAANH